MGASFWESMSSRKIELSKGYSVALADLMVKAQDREDFNHILQGKSKRGSVVYQLLQSLIDASLHPFGHSAEDDSDPQNEGAETGESLAKLFNPFRRPPSQHHQNTAQASSYSMDDQDPSSPGKNSHRSHHSQHGSTSPKGRAGPATSSHSASSDQGDHMGRAGIKGIGSLSHSGEHSHDHSNYNNNNNTNNNNKAAHHKDSAKSVPTIVLGATSEEFGNENGTLGQ